MEKNNTNAQIIIRKYDCTKTLDIAHEIGRLCIDQSRSEEGCENCILGEYCDSASGLYADYITEEVIRNMQYWSDTHPE